MKKYKGLIFDFNGVLVDDVPLHRQAWRELIQEIANRTFSKIEFDDILNGRSNAEIFNLLHGRSLKAQEHEVFERRKEGAYQTLARAQGNSYRLAEGAVELFEILLSRKVPFTIGTSSPSMNVLFFNEMFKLETWFDLKKIVCADGTVHGKPAPDIYLKAANMLGLHPSGCVVIEDAPLGIQAARAAGIGHIIAIGPSEEHNRLSQVPGVNGVVSSLSEIDITRLF